MQESNIYEWSLDTASNENVADISWKHGQLAPLTGPSMQIMMSHIKRYIADSGYQYINYLADNNFDFATSKPISKLYRSMQLGFTTTNNDIFERKIEKSADRLYNFVAYGNTEKQLKDKAKNASVSFRVVLADNEKDCIGFARNLPHKSYSAVPIGTIMPYAGDNDPKKGWVIAQGQSLAKADYPELYQYLKGKWGNSSEVATESHFKLPDLRGVFLRGFNIDDKIELGTFSDSTVKKHSHNYEMSVAGNHGHNEFFYHRAGYDRTAKGPALYVENSRYSLEDLPYLQVDGEHSHELTFQENGENEMRPKNIAVNFIIKVENTHADK